MQTKSLFSLLILTLSTFNQPTFALSRRDQLIRNIARELYDREAEAEAFADADAEALAEAEDFNDHYARDFDDIYERDLAFDGYTGNLFARDEHCTITKPVGATDCKPNSCTNAPGVSCKMSNKKCAGTGMRGQNAPFDCKGCSCSKIG